MSSPATGVLLRMIEIFVNGDVSEEPRTVADEYVDHQGLGQGPLHGPAGFALDVLGSGRGRVVPGDNLRVLATLLGPSAAFAS